MNKNLVYITENITFKDIKNGTYKRKEVYFKQMKNWFFKPAQLLLESSKTEGSYEYKLAIMTILITFFESHGQYLEGIGSNRRSKRVFTSGFEAYLDYLVQHEGHVFETYSTLNIQKFYELVRCGLVHNGYIGNGDVSFLIDILNHDTKHVIYINPMYCNNWLINVENMLCTIESYLNYYLQQMDNDQNVKERFEKMFDKFYSI
ncbi:hypothetical protein [Paenibacillus wenxiniae]|uniref:Apea-like HEPN domain-containing protein n=1 Tax=Paenibacillus wenxiniae TaxID=1636843 RepID=A0ABW4RG55_9BACL